MSADERAGRPGEFDLWRRLTLMVGQLNQSLERLLASEYQISLPELMVLVELRYGHERGTRVQELSAAVGLDQSSMSRLVTRLENKGLTARVSCEHDRRGVYCTLTPAGAERGERAEARCREELTGLLDVASFDDRWAALVARFRHTAAGSVAP
ncbi:MarR family winged helix-turn-helix transcriptional regulator [Streptomyces olivaceus]|uniref:MarR family transcriptional regulator n=1 Tax=Streptomyces olivaceus TaxID=47716 RepID=A0ABS7W4R1_STROV|nr:MarR family transcriptional regulator [Streptomyces olivaceus]AOW89537.1 MarR family transcriptional regulator [Streptomyces olivaceus]MBZ6092441.1 MarR family transcriptional regulator [Streptomyces olivaceus]MBZ6098723.1 MarR family transcriptional regulator [Streptomyces olivaceus]MBZ6100850.1 MarR family transcriptional regulator [Streptomyces olivaceus]MBZ6120925.1 MarR family transcriptional regulator [Streptomyces olivaceus]